MAGDLLARIDRAIAELVELRGELAGFDALNPSAAKGMDTVHTLADDDLSPEHLLEVSTAVSRFNRPPDSIRWMCRKQNCGVKRGGRWLASAPRLSRYLNGGE
jgi:hypothetical protein